MSKTSILVSGSNGQLGQALQELSVQYPGLTFDFRTKDTLDITEPEMVIETLNSNPYDYFINCAAYTAVDKAESDEQNCYEINAYAPMLLSMLAADNGTTMIHISTDYVYHIAPDRPLIEEDECNPKGVYAKSKLEGENNIIGASDQHIILRTSWLYGDSGANFVKTMLRLSKTNDSLSIVNDQIGTPTYASDLAKAILDIIQGCENNPDENYGGIYNFSNASYTNWASFAKEIFKLKKIDIKVLPIPSIDYPTPAARPLWSVMNTDKIKDIFGLEIRDWKLALEEMLGK